MALQRVGSSVYRQALSPDSDKAAQARAMLARKIAEGLARFEVLTESPAPQNEATFAVPVARMMGEMVPPGLPPMRDR